MHQLKKSSKKCGKKGPKQHGRGNLRVGLSFSLRKLIFIGLGCAGAYEPDPISVLVKLNAISH